MLLLPSKSKYVTEFYYHKSTDAMMKLHNILCNFNCGIKMNDANKMKMSNKIKKTRYNKKNSTIDDTSTTNNIKNNFKRCLNEYHLNV